jgi:hypothetical protein
MMQRWANEEDEENGCFPKHNNDKRNNDNRSNKGQQNYSGSSPNRKPDDLVVAVEHNPHGKKSGNQQDQFEKDPTQTMPDAPKVEAHTLLVHQLSQVSQRTSP